MNEESSEQYEPLNYLQYLSYSALGDSLTSQAKRTNEDSTLVLNNEHATDATIFNNESSQQKLRPEREVISEFIQIVNTVNSFASTQFKKIIEFLNSNCRDEEFDRQISKELINIIKKTKAEERIPKLCILDAMTKSLSLRFANCFAPRLLEVFTETFLKSKENNTKRALIQIFNGWRNFYCRDRILKPISDRVKLPFFEKTLFVEAPQSDLDEYYKLISSQIETPVIAQSSPAAQTTSNIPEKKACEEVQATNVQNTEVSNQVKWENTNQVSNFANSYKESNCVNNSYLSNNGLYGFGVNYDTQNSQFINPNIQNCSYEISNKHCLASQSSTKFALRDPLISHPKVNVNQKDMSYFSECSLPESQKVEPQQADQFRSLHQQMTGLVPTLKQSINSKIQEANMYCSASNFQSRILAAPSGSQETKIEINNMRPINNMCREISKDGSVFLFVSNQFNSICQNERNQRDYEKFSGDLKKIRIKNMIEALYSNLSYQCKCCGMRFQSHSILKTHLDDDHFLSKEIEFRKEYKDKKITNSRPCFNSREDFIGKKATDCPLAKEKKISGLIELYDVQSDNFLGHFDYSQVISVEDVKSNYLCCVMCGERFHTAKCYSDDCYYYANAKLIVINDNDPFLIHLDKCYPMILKAQQEEESNENNKIQNNTKSSTKISEKISKSKNKVSKSTKKTDTTDNLKRKSKDKVKITVKTECDQKFALEQNQQEKHTEIVIAKEEVKINSEIVIKKEEIKLTQNENSKSLSSAPVETVETETRKRSESCDSSDADSPLDTNQLLMEISNKFHKTIQNKTD